MKGIRFTWNRQNKRSFGKFLAGNPTRPPARVQTQWFSGHLRHGYSVSRIGVLFEIEIPCILLFLNWNKNNQNCPKRMHPQNVCLRQKLADTLHASPSRVVDQLGILVIVNLVYGTFCHCLTRQTLVTFAAALCFPRCQKFIYGNGLHGR